MTDNVYFLQLGKSYKSYLKNIIAGEPFRPIILRGGKNKPATTAELHKAITLFQQYEKKDTGYGWEIEWQKWSSNKLGNQLWPVAITVATEADYLFLTKKQSDTEKFKEELQHLLSWRSEIKDFLLSEPGSVLQYLNAWKGICAVTDYLLLNDVTTHYIRSIPVPVHTKFIKDNEWMILSLLKYLNPALLPANCNNIEIGLDLRKKSQLFTLRWLDPRLADLYTSGIGLLGIPVDTLKMCHWKIDEIWLVENETNLYLMPERNNALVIFSKGYAMELLYDIPLFHRSSILYWGDLDEDGFNMLNRFRKHYPHVRSIFMDQYTLDTHQEDIGKQNEKYKIRELKLLTPAERNAFEQLLSVNGRLEQEKLNQQFIIKTIIDL
ncbi:MAG: hypothetical protein J0I32_04530 [Sphingobacteriales bacterium]|nr:hypothetical protein [Sphingobacteriales bacterium]OJV98427.1 MAG: hypothetical protein BGO52_11605 [Sphingobacteriales bacterium 44-61]